MSLINQLIVSNEENAPLCVLVHGRGFDMFAMKVFERALPVAAHRLYVQAPFNDPKGGFCWWDISQEQDPFDGVQALGHFLLHELPLIVRSFANQDIALFGYGFSQGAATLSGFIQQHPTFFQKVALLAGFVLEVKKLAEDIPSRRRTKVLMIHGTEDDVVPLLKAQQGAAFLRSRAFDVELMENNVSHKIGVDGMRRLTLWGRE